MTAQMRHVSSCHWSRSSASLLNRIGLCATGCLTSAKMGGLLPVTLYEPLFYRAAFDDQTLAGPRYTAPLSTRTWSDGADAEELPQPQRIQ